MIQGLLFDFFGTLVIYDEIKGHIKQSLTFKWCNFGTVMAAKALYP
jgi:hypothetical protein